MYISILIGTPSKFFNWLCAPAFASAPRPERGSNPCAGRKKRNGPVAGAVLLMWWAMRDSAHPLRGSAPAAGPRGPLRAPLDKRSRVCLSSAPRTGFESVRRAQKTKRPRRRGRPSHVVGDEGFRASAPRIRSRCGASRPLASSAGQTLPRLPQLRAPNGVRIRAPGAKNETAPSPGPSFSCGGR